MSETVPIKKITRPNKAINQALVAFVTSPMLRVSLANPPIIAFEDLKDQSLNPVYMKDYKL
jgi:hypothetical protein